MAQVVFSHANGIPAKSYLKFFEYLKPHKVSYIEAFGLGEFKINVNWKSSVQELIQFIEKNFSEPVVGMGHSFGGVVTIFASSLRPDLFSKVIVIDPPLFGTKKRMAIGTMRLIGKEDKIYHFPRLARIRKSQFPSREKALEYFRSKPFFRKFDKQCLEDYVTYGLKENEKGVELLISPFVESEVFRLMPCFFSKRFLSPKHCFFLYAKKGAHNKDDLKWLKRSLKNTEFLGFEGGHMMPVENPESMAEIINSFI